MKLSIYNNDRILLLLCHLYFWVNVESLIVPYLLLNVPSRPRRRLDVNTAVSLLSITRSTTTVDETTTTTSPTTITLPTTETKERLTFQVNIHLTSDPIPNVTINELGEFLSTKVCRDIFLSAGRKTECIEIQPISEELKQMWDTECQSHYGPTMLYENGDALIQSESIVQFPGLKMVNVVYSGVKTRFSSQDNLPYYDIILVGERKQVFGAPPIVWIFNTLTGHSSEKEGVLQSPSARVQSVISVVDDPKEESSLVVGPYFDFDCNAKIVVEFPKAMMKILPISKEKMEEQGTVSVKKAIEKDIINALNCVIKVYLDLLKSK